MGDGPRRAGPAAAPYVLNYCDYDERTGSFVRRRELPGARVVAIMNLGEPIRVRAPEGEWAEHRDGFFAGLHDTYAITETSGAQRGVQIDLTPVGAYLLLRLPMYHLRAGSSASTTCSTAPGAPCTSSSPTPPAGEQRFDCSTRSSSTASTTRSHPSRASPARSRACTPRAGTVAIQTLTDELGCSRRHLNEGFKEHVGISPKLLARILRFNRAVELSATPLAWAEVSQTCGYYDQAHMVRDFQQFSGYSPTEFARRRLPDGGGFKAD